MLRQAPFRKSLIVKRIRAKFRCSTCTPSPDRRS